MYEVKSNSAKQVSKLEFIWLALGIEIAAKNKKQDWWIYQVLQSDLFIP